ncbi:MAG: UMP kinase [Candidatus Gracilibacteria bacterium]|nr:UMP kinase [Candidatus Gracilibacteria bacterium]MDQ7022607.1 UMP kinase [Candidatus Gracilibacteria bacterium]
MRVVIKVSGEALAGCEKGGLDYIMLDKVGDIIKDLIKSDIEVGVVVGAGNFIRGAEIEKIKIDRCNADNMGMLAININTIALSDVLERKGIDTKIVNSFGIDGIAERFNKQKAIKYIKNKKVVIFGGGTGNPFFTTDTAGVLRALEIEADMMIKATKVDGVYTKDPMKYDDAEFIKKVTYNEVIQKRLRVMDFTSIALAMENNLVVKVLSLNKEGAIKNAILGGDEGTTISA